MQNEIKYTRYFSQTPQEVWAYLTQPELLEQWLGKTDFQPIAGHKFRFFSPYGNDCICEVLEVKPFTMLSYSWQKNSSKDNLPFDSKIVWTLAEKENGTELHLVHNGFTALEDIVAHEGGWNACFRQLEELVNTGKKSYTVKIEVAKSPQEVFNHLKEVSKWWSEDYEGCSANLHDEFVICHPGAHYSKQQLIEVIDDKKIVWLVTGSELDWLKKDKHEWTNTKMIFEITANGDKTALHFTHMGLMPEKECYARCEQGWNMVIKDWLFNYITAGKEI